MFQCKVVCISMMLFTNLKSFLFSAAIDGLADNDPIPPAIQQMLLVLQVRSSSTGADPGFLERGFICIKVGGLFSCFYLMFLKYPMKMK